MDLWREQSLPNNGWTSHILTTGGRFVFLCKYRINYVMIVEEIKDFYSKVTAY